MGSFGVRAMMILDMMMMIVLKMIATIILNVVFHGHWSTLNIIIIRRKGASQLALLPQFLSQPDLKKVSLDFFNCPATIKILCCRNYVIN